MGNALRDNVTSSNTHQQLDQVGVRLIDMGTNASDIEMRSQRDGARVIDSDDDNVQVSCPHVDVIIPSGMNEEMPMPHISLSISRYGPELLRGSHTRTHDTRMQEMIPQLDGPVSVQSRSRRRMSENARIEQASFQRTTASHRREYPGKSSDDTHSDRRTYDDQRPPERRHQDQNGRPLDRRNYQDRGYSGRDYTGQDGRSPGREGPPDRNIGSPDNGGPPDEDPLMMEDPLEMNNILDTLEDKDHQDPKDPPHL